MLLTPRQSRQISSFKLATLYIAPCSCALDANLLLTHQPAEPVTAPHSTTGSWMSSAYSSVHPVCNSVQSVRCSENCTEFVCLYSWFSEYSGCWMWIWNIVQCQNWRTLLTTRHALHYCDPGPLNKESFYLFTVDEVFLIVPHGMKYSVVVKGF